VAPLWSKLSRPPRLHLIGHSFGAKLVTSMALGGARPASVTLLLAAFSAFAFAPVIPGFRRPGFYYPVLAERRVDGPIVVLRSDHDTALGTFYRTITGSGEVDRAGARDGARPAGRLARAATVAASALGAIGARAAWALRRLISSASSVPGFRSTRSSTSTGRASSRRARSSWAPIATSSTARSPR
jgi:hypothetical protein